MEILSWLPSFLVWLPTIVFCVIILFRFLQGLSRGFRKSLILFINSIIAFLLCVGLFFLIFGRNFDTTALKLWLKLSSFTPIPTPQDILGLTGEFDSLSSLIITKYFTDYSGNLHFIELASLVVGFAESTLKLIMIFVMVIFYFIFKILLYIVYLIFFREGRKKRKIRIKAKRIKRKNKKEAKKAELLGEEYDGKELPQYRRKWLGGSVIGLVRGFIAATLFLSLIGTFYSLATGGDYSDEKSNFSISINDKQFEIGEYYDVLNMYGAKGIGKIYESLTNKDGIPLYLLMFDYATNGTYVKYDENGEKVINSFYLRRDLAPFVAFVKNTGLILNEYGLDPNNQSMDYFIEFFSSNNVVNDISLPDRLREEIDKAKMGDFMLFLSQSFVNAMLSYSFKSANPDSMAYKVLDIIFNESYSIKGEDLINQENITNSLHLIIDVLENGKTINDFAISLTESSSGENALGIRYLKNASDVSSKYDPLRDFLKVIEKRLKNYTFLKEGKIDKLLSGLLVGFMELFNPEFSLDGVKEEDSKVSIFNVRWVDSITDILDISLELMIEMSKSGAKTSDEIIKLFIDNIDNPRSNIGLLTSKIINNDILGVILNARGIKDLMEVGLSKMKIETKIPNDLVLGSYYDKSGHLVEGEIYKIYKVLIGEIKTIYNIYQSENRASIKAWLADDHGLLEKALSLFDETKEEHSLFAQFVFSAMYTGFRFNDSKIYLPSESFDHFGDITVIKSSEIMQVLNMALSLKSELIKDKIDYQDIFKMVDFEEIAKCTILLAPLSNFTYSTMAKNAKMNKFIPNKYVLETDEDKENNIENWAGSNGELKKILVGLSRNGVLNTIIDNKGNLDTLNFIELFMNAVDDDKDLKELFESELLSVVLTGTLMESSIGNMTLIIPDEACGEPLDGKKRLKPEEFENLIKIIKNTKMKEILENKEGTSGSALQVLSDMDDSEFSIIAESYILNATFTNLLTTITIGEYQVIVPSETLNVASTSPMLMSDELRQFLTSTKLMFGGSFDFDNMKINELLNEEKLDEALKSNVLHATMINMVIDIFSKDNMAVHIALPHTYKLKVESVANFEYDGFTTSFTKSRWYINDEIKNFVKYKSLIGIDIKDDNSISFNEGIALKLIIGARKADSDFNKVTQSEIMYYSFSSMMLKQEYLVFINDVRVDLIKEDEETEFFIDKKALYDFFDVVLEMLGEEGNTKLSNGELTFAELKTYMKLDSSSMLDISIEKYKEYFNSIIVHASFATELINALTNDTNKNKVSLPSSYRNLNKEVIEASFLLTRMYSNNEIINTLRGLKVLGINTLDVTVSANTIFKLKESVDDTLLESLSYDEVDKPANKLDVLYNTDILWYTLSSKLIANRELSVPIKMIRDRRDSKYPNDDYITKMEISSILDALKTLGITDLEEVISPDILFNNKDMLDNLFNSKIIHLTMSEKLKKTIKVPSFSISKEEGYEFVSANEIEDLITKLDSISTNFTNFNVETIINLDTNKLEELLNNTIIRYNVSLKVFELDKFVVTADIVEELSGQMFVKKADLISLISAVKTVVSDTTTDILASFSIDLNSLIAIEGNIDTLLDSKIVLASVSNKLFESGHKTKLESATLERRYMNADFIENYYIMSKADVSSFISFAKAVGLTDYNSRPANMTNVLSHIGESEIARITYSESLLELLGVLNPSTEVIEVVSYDINASQFIVIDKTVISKESLN